MEDYKDKETLERLYWEEEMSQPEIAELFNVTHPTIGNWMEKLDIKTRKANHEKPPHLKQSNGYYTIETRIGDDRVSIKVHRLVAVAEYGFEAVCGNDVHHKNNCGIDNRPENLEIMSHSEHMSYHTTKTWQRHGKAGFGRS